MVTVNQIGMADQVLVARTPVDTKVTVNFKHAGDAPILKKSTFKLPAATTIATVADQLRKQLQLAPHDPLVCLATNLARCSHVAVSVRGAGCAMP